MKSKITQGIKIEVEVFYDPAQSNVLQNIFTFVYRIIIVNFSPNVIKLMRRHWQIKDAFNNLKEVEGEGVIGEQPVLAPNEQFIYVSGVSINTEIGKMFGTYTMKNMHDKKEFLVNIPEFPLVANFKLN